MVGILALEAMGAGAEAPGPARLGGLMDALGGAEIELETAEHGFGVATCGSLTGAG
jgi:hypothetical protein